MSFLSPSPRTDPLTRDLAQMHELLVGLSRHACLRDPVAADSDELHLTAPQMHVVLSLGHSGPLTMGELSRRGGVSEKTMTGIVDRMEQSGDVRRERDSGDRRLVRVHLTAAGEKTFNACDRHVADRLRRFLSLFDSDDRAALLRMLGKLNEKLAAGAAALPEER